MDHHKTIAPALEGGLTILDMLAESPAGLSFTEIEKLLPQSKATVIRLLKVLMLREYIVKNPLNGKYLPGRKMISFSQHSTAVEFLKITALPFLKELTEKTSCTSILFAWNGVYLQSILKEMHPSSIVMQELGVINRSFVDGPWGWICLDQILPDGFSDWSALAKQSRLAHPFNPEWLYHFRQNGYAIDRDTLFPGLCRMAVPVIIDNQLCACIGLGGTVHAIPDDKIEWVAEMMVQCAQKISSGKI